jgi:hypothetical protein
MFFYAYVQVFFLLGNLISIFFIHMQYVYIVNNYYEFLYLGIKTKKIAIVQGLSN